MDNKMTSYSLIQKMIMLSVLQSVFLLGGIMFHSLATYELSERLFLILFFIALLMFVEIISLMVGKLIKCVLLIIRVFLIIFISVNLYFGSWFIFLGFGSIILIQLLSNSKKYIVTYICFTLGYGLVILIMGYFNLYDLVYLRLKITFILILVTVFAYELTNETYTRSVSRYLDDLEEYQKKNILYAKAFERESISKRLRDSLVTGVESVIDKLENAHLLLESNNIDKLEEIVSELLPQTREIMDESRGIMDELREVKFERRTFLTLLKKNIDNIHELVDTNISYSVSETIADKLPFVLQEHLLYIIGASIKKAVYNSYAEHINVMLNGNDEFVSIKIIDDGDGENFNILGGKYSHHYNMSINERARIINANVKIISKVGKGTIVDIIVKI